MSPTTLLIPLADQAALAAWIARSHHEPVMIFKHSATCGTSAAAREEVEAFLRHTPGAPPCALIVVQAERRLSSAVAEQFGIAHHSPQVLVVAGGAVCWHASHWRITAQALGDALASLSAVPK